MLKKTATITILLVLFGLATGCMESQESQFNRLTAEGEAHFFRREYSEALSVWLAALKIRSDDGVIIFNLGKTYLKLSDYKAGTEALRQAAKILPDQPEVHHELAKALLISGNLAEAEPLIKTLLKNSSDTSTPNILLGDLEMLKDNFASAEQYYRNAVLVSAANPLAMAKMALSQIAQGNIKTAADTYRQVAKLETSDIDTLLQMYHYQRFRGDTQKAEELLQKAIHIEPEDLSLQMEIAEFFISSSRYKSASNALERLIPKLHDPIIAEKLLAEVMLAQGRMSDAHSLIDQIRQSTVNDAEIEIIRGKYHLLSMEYAAAIGAFNSALQISPKTSMVYYLLGVTYLADGRIYLSRNNLIQALSLDPYYTEADLLLGDIYYKNEEYDLAAEHARRIVLKEPENFRAHQILANIRAAQGAREDAIGILENAQKLSPESALPLYQMAIIVESVQNLPEALVYYERLLDENPDLTDAISRYADLLLQLNRKEEAGEFILSAIKRNPENPFLYQILAKKLYIESKYSDAIEALETSIRLAPQSTHAYSMMADIYGKLSDFSKQQKILTACINAVPEFIPTYIKLADNYRRELNFSSAIETLKAGLAYNSESPWLMSNLAWIYLEQKGKINEAFSLAQSAFEQLPDEPSVSDTLGWAYYIKGLHDQALWILNDTVKKEPQNPIFSYHIGMVYLAKDDIAKAETNIQTAIDLGLGSPYREEAEEALKQITTKTDG